MDLNTQMNGRPNLVSFAPDIKHHADYTVSSLYVTKRRRLSLQGSNCACNPYTSKLWPVETQPGLS